MSLSIINGKRAGMFVSIIFFVIILATPMMPLLRVRADFTNRKVSGTIPAFTDVFVYGITPDWEFMLMT